MISKKYKPVEDVAKKAGKIIEKYFGASLETVIKSNDADFVTKADLESEELIVKALGESYPDYNIFSEEKGLIDKGSEYTFYIDPLDGTNNFFIGIPYFSISIGLVKDRQTIFGLVYNPIIKNLYWAEKDKGSFLNNKKLKISDENNPKQLTLAYVQGYGMPNARSGMIIEKLFEKGVKRVLFNWSCALDLCLLAEGKVEGLVFEDGEIYDFSAGKLIAREAGAIITDLDGKKDEKDVIRDFIVGNVISTNLLISKVL